MIKEFSLEGKKALVTGGSSGLGKAIALVFAEAGADVALAARTLANLEATAEEVRKLGRQAAVIQTDVSSSEEVEVMVARATEELGQVDIVVSNAGTGGGGPIAPLPEAPPPPFGAGYINPSDVTTRHTDEDWHRVLDTNLSGTFYVCRAVAPQMLERRRGKIITVASTNAVMAYPFGAAYQTSKAGMRMLTKVMATEWAQFNINVNCILPGWFVTEMTRRGFENPEIRKSREDWVPLKRLTDNRDLGLLALYLASPATDWMTGQVIALDGGETAVYN